MTNFQKSAISNAITNSDPLGLLSFPPDLARLKSALCVLPNNIDARTLALYRVSPVAREARLFPEMADALHDLLLSWFLGSLQGAPATPSMTKSPNGISGIQYFEALWQHFFKNTDYRGKPTTLGSLYYHAKQLGWEYEAAAAIDVSEDESLQ